MKSLKTLLVVLLAAGSMVACNKNDTGAVTARGNTASLGTPGSAVGSVTNYDMTNQVRGFLTVDGFDSQSVKSVSSSTGLIFNGVVRFDNNILIPQQSYLNMRITYLDQNNAQQSVDLGIYGSQGYIQPGYNSTLAHIEFEDQYGAVVLHGNFDTSIFTGTISYRNNGSNDSGTLGQFRIQTCGFFKCI